MDHNEENKITRRRFSQLGAAAGFAVLTGAGRTGNAEVNGDTLKIGLLGCGGRGTGAAEQMLQGNENVVMVALGDLFPEKVESTRKTLAENQNTKVRNKVNITDDHCFTGIDAYKKICDTDIDILMIGTIPYGKAEQFEYAVAKNKHVFIEKPIGVDPVSVRRFIKAAEQHKANGKSLVAGTQRRHQLEYQQTIEKIHAGEIGDIVHLRAYWAGELPFVREREQGETDLHYRIRNWINYCWTSGDNIVEQHVHNLDVCNWVMNSHPVSVFASGGRNWKPLTEKYGDMYDHFDCDYEYAGGIHMTSMSRHWDGCSQEVSEEAIGTKGRSNCTNLGKRGLNPYIQEHVDLVNSIRGTGAKWHEGVQVAESTMTAIMGRMSAYTGKKLTWDDALNSDLSIIPEPLDLDTKIPVLPVPVPVNDKKIR